MICRDSAAGRRSLGIARREVAGFERCYTAGRTMPMTREVGRRAPAKKEK